MDDAHDPFDWPTERLIQELFLLRRSQDARPANKWPDLERLAERLREHELDGFDLLTYEQLGGAEPFSTLCKDLGVFKIPHKTTLHLLVELLRDMSPAYEAWKQGHLAKRTGTDSPRASSVPRTQTHTLSTPPLLPPPLPPPPPSPLHARASSALASSPPKKRKRITPIHIADPPERSANRLFSGNTETETAAHAPEPLWQDSPPGAYLGDWKLPQDRLLHENDPLQASGAEYVDFGWAAPRPIPAGRRLQVERILRRYFKPKRARQLLGRRSSLAAGADTADGDVVLPLLGESDDEEYDSETWAEMEQEAQERANPPPQKDAPLSVEAVDAAVQEAICSIEAAWAQKKLPRLRRDMHRLWTEAQQSGVLRANARAELATAERLGQRIANIAKAIYADEWRTEAQVRQQVRILDASVEDRQRALWRAKLFASPTQPPKPAGTVTPVRRARALRAVAAANGDEVLTSASESESDDDDDDLGKFIVQVAAAATAAVAESMLVDSESDTDTLMPEVVEPAASGPAEAGKRPPLDDLAAIADKGASFWADRGDVTRLLCCLLSEYDDAILRPLFGGLGEDISVIWNTLCVPVMREDPAEPVAAVAGAFVRLFDAFTARHSVGAHSFFPLSNETRARLEASRSRIGEFCVQLRILQPYFAARLEAVPEVPLELSAPPAAPESNSNSDSNRGGDADTDDKDVRTSPSYNGRRKIRTDRAAQTLREKDKARMEALNRRREANGKTLERLGTVDGDRSRLIINDAREANETPIYINDDIGARIRTHQIQGVRFLWAQLLVPAAVRQGCLLAHTMGLGKTMQVITLLVTMAEAAASSDASIVAQVPVDLRQSKTLILCPSGLVENWLDEISYWTPDGLLGACYAITAEVGSDERLATARRWADQGGILVLGYPMLRKLLEEFSDAVRTLLETAPHVVVADEAHALKNPKSRLHQATANFQTTARIAMTGSPLANSVEEYHSMINWVAPNYLADHREFAATYANPIKEGFFRDSTPHQKKLALTRLRALKETVAPKIHRITMADLAIKSQLPPKKEFILYLPLTPLQQQVYCTFINMVNDPAILGDIDNTVQLWNLMYNLTLLLAHPQVFLAHLAKMQADLQSDNEPGPPAHAAPTLPLSMVQRLLSAVRQGDVDALADSSKVVVLMGILDEARAAGDKVLVFSQSRLVLDYLEAVFVRKQRLYQRLDGDTAVRRRQGMVKSFNAGQDEIYLISTTAGGVGLNIHGANRVVIFDFKWNPMHEQQAIGRAYRIGQAKPVFVYWLIVGGTFETVLHDQAVFKTQLASRVVDRRNPHAWADQIRNYTAPPQVWPRDSAMARFAGEDVALAALLRNDNTSQHLSKIVSTDTFEEEEPESKLSAEDMQEAESLFRLDRMRRQMHGGDGSLHVGVAGGPAGVAGLFGPPLPLAPGLPVLPSSRPLDAAGAQLPLPLPLYDGGGGRPAATGDLLPMRIAAPAQGAGAAGLYDDTPDGLEHVLLNKLLEGRLVSQPRMSFHAARGIANKLVSDIACHIGPGGLPVRAQWARLRDLARASDVFANAIVAVDISARTLATMTGPEMERMVAELQVVGAAAATTAGTTAPAPTAASTASTTSTRTPSQTSAPAGERNRDPDHIRAHLRRSMHRKGRRGRSWSRDIMAMREVLDRRQTRQHRGATDAQVQLWPWPAGAEKTEPPNRIERPEMAPSGPARPVGAKSAGNDIDNPLVLD